MKILNYFLGLYRSTGMIPAQPVQECGPVLQCWKAVIHGEESVSYAIDRYVPGMRVKFYCDGDEGEIIGSYWIYNEEKKCLRMSFKVQYDDGEVELWGASWLKAATAVIGVPTNFRELIEEQIAKRDALQEKYGINKKFDETKNCQES